MDQFAGAVADQEMDRVQLPAGCESCDQIMAGRIRVMARERQRFRNRAKDPFRRSQRVDAGAEVDETARRAAKIPRGRVDVASVMIPSGHTRSSPAASSTAR